MVQKKGKRTLVATLSILVVLLVAIGTIALIRITVNGDKKDTSDTTTQTTDTDTSDETTTEEPSAQKPDEVADEETAIDPATVATIDVTSLGISVSYVKGVGAFSYETLRAANGTKYVEFRNEDLIGTKCTNDEGTFASILVNPTDAEKGTLTKTTSVGDTEYGLSLADTTCTSDADKLATFQKSFSDAFSLLKQL